MNTLKPLFICLLALGLVLPASAQKHYTDLEYPPLPDFDIPEAERVELDNGMILFLIEDHELPLVNISARIAGGGVYDPADKVGRASIAGAVMRTGGTTHISGDELNERLENIAASIETFGGSTSSGAFMNTLVEHTGEVLPLFADVLMNPAFPEDKIDLAKTQQKSNISRRNDNPQQIAFREFDEVLYGSDSPYARSTEYFTIDAITQDDLFAFHNEFYHPNNTILGIWGDFETEEMVAMIEEAFQDWPKAENFEAPDPPLVEASNDYGVYFAPKDDVNQSVVLMGHPGEVRRDDEDYFALTVMNEILSGGFSSRLFQNVRDDQGLAYAVFGGYSANYDRPGRFFAGVMTKSETTVEAAESVLHEIEKMQEAPPTDEEMTQAKDAFLNSFVFNFDTRREIVNRMMTYEYYDYPMDYLEKEKAGIEEVTGDDVLEVSKKYLKPEEVKIMVVGRDEDFGEPLSTLGDVTDVDITIPTSREPAPEATEETLSQGRALLHEMADAMGGVDAFAQVERLQATTRQDVTTPDNQSITMEAQATFIYPGDVKFTQKTPMGEMSLVKKGDQVTMIAPQGEMDAPPPVRQFVADQIWRSFPFLFRELDAEGLTVQHAGQEEVEGQPADVLVVHIPGGSSFTVYVSQDTRLPVSMEYTSMNQMGAPVEARDVYDDFRTVEGMTLPFSVVTTIEGQGEVVSTTESVVVNDEVEGF